MTRDEAWADMLDALRRGAPITVTVKKHRPIIEDAIRAVWLDDGPDLVFSTSPAPDGIDTDCMFLASPGRISVHISRRAVRAQVARADLAETKP